MTSFPPCKQGFPSARQGGSDWVCANLILVDCRGSCSLLPAQVPATTPPDVGLPLPSHVPFRFSFPFRSHSHPHPSSDLHRRLPSSPSHKPTNSAYYLLAHLPRAHFEYIFCSYHLLSFRFSKSRPLQEKSPLRHLIRAALPRIHRGPRHSPKGTVLRPRPSSRDGISSLASAAPLSCVSKSTCSFHSFCVVGPSQSSTSTQSNPIPLTNTRTTERRTARNPSTSLSTRHSHPLIIHLNRRHAISEISYTTPTTLGSTTARTARWFTTRNMATAPLIRRVRRTQEAIHSPSQPGQTPTARLCLPFQVRVVASHSHRFPAADPTRHSLNPLSISCPPLSPCLAM